MSLVTYQMKPPPWSQSATVSFAWRTLFACSSVRNIWVMVVRRRGNPEMGDRDLPNNYSPGQQWETNAKRPWENPGAFAFQIVVSCQLGSAATADRAEATNYRHTDQRQARGFGQRGWRVPIEPINAQYATAAITTVDGSGAGGKLSSDAAAFKPIALCETALLNPPEPS